jgi:hypothetical protein
VPEAFRGHKVHPDHEALTVPLEVQVLKVIREVPVYLVLPVSNGLPDPKEVQELRENVENLDRGDSRVQRASWD